MTENTRHTPGPWTIYNTDGLKILKNWRVKGSVGYQVCTMNTATTTEEEYANARLIAAAPDLLEACKRALAVLEKEPACQIYSAHAQIVRAAIARAKGERS